MVRLTERTWFKAGITVILSGLASAFTLLVAGSERPVEQHNAGHHMSSNMTDGNTAQDNRPPYSPFMVGVVIEAVKFAVCMTVVATLAIRRRRQKRRSQVAGQTTALEPAAHPPYGVCRESLWYMVPSFLYMIDNSLMYFILMFLDPATHILLWQLKIPVTAFLFRILLKRPLSTLKWCAILLLFIGVLTTQSNDPKLLEKALSGDATGKAAGVVLVLVGVFVSAFAGVYTEWVLKRRDHHGFFAQNAMLYAWGMVFNFGALVVRDHDQLSQGFLQGCTWYCPAIIAVNASMGLSYAVVFKFVNNIATLYAHVFSLLTIIFVSWLAFDLELTMVLLCGFATCVMSLFLYNLKLPAPGEPVRGGTGGVNYSMVSTAGDVDGSDGDDTGHGRGVGDVELAGVGTRGPGTAASRSRERSRSQRRLAQPEVVDDFDDDLPSSSGADD